MVDTFVLDASAHGPVFAHCLITERLLTCEAPSAEMLDPAGSSETFIARILQQDKIQDALYSRQVYANTIQ